MSRLAKNIFYNIVGQSVVLILGFVAVKYIYSQLGGDVVGILYFSMMANTTLCMVLELGICSATVKEVAAHHQNDTRYTHDFIRVFSGFYWILFFVFGGLVYLCAPLLTEHWVNLRSIDSNTAADALRILLVSALLSLPKSFYASVIRGVQRMEINNVIDVVTTAVQQLGIVVIIMKRGDLFQIAYWMAVTHLLSLVAYMVACTFFLPSKWALVPGYANGIIGRNFKYTSQMTVISLTALAYLQADKIILSKVLPIDVFGYYYFAYSVVSKGALITMAISYAVFPHMSNLYSAGGRDVLEKRYHSLQDMLCLLIVPGFAAIAYAALPLFSILFNEEIAKSLVLPTFFLCIGFYMTGTLTIPNNISFVVGKQDIVARQNIWAVIVVLPLTALLIWKWGMVGASLSIMIYGLFCYFYSIPKICVQCIGMPVKDWYLHILKIYGMAGLTFGSAYFVLTAIEHVEIYSLAIAFLLSTLCMAASSYFLIGPESKKVIAPIFAARRWSWVK